MSHARSVVQSVISDLEALGTSDVWRDTAQDSADARNWPSQAAQRLAGIIDCVPGEPFDKR